MDTSSKQAKAKNDSEWRIAIGEWFSGGQRSCAAEILLLEGRAPA